MFAKLLVLLLCATIASLGHFKLLLLLLEQLQLYLTNLTELLLLLSCLLKSKREIANCSEKRRPKRWCGWACGSGRRKKGRAVNDADGRQLCASAPAARRRRSLGRRVANRLPASINKQNRAGRAINNQRNVAILRNFTRPKFHSFQANFKCPLRQFDT